MRTSCRFILAAISAVILPGNSNAGEFDPDYCAEARELLANSRPSEALAASQKCTADYPDDTSERLIQVRILSELKRFDDAMNLVHATLDKYPEDLDWRIMKVRVLAWKGEMAAAQKEIDGIPPDAALETETMRVFADVAFWRGDCARAVKLYSEVLDREPNRGVALKNRGECYRKAGDYALAEKDLTRLCSLPPESGGSCGQLIDARKEGRRFFLFIQPAYAVVVDRPDEWEIYGQFDARVWKRLSLGISADWRWRYYVNNQSANDVYTEIHANYKTQSNIMLYGSLGGTFHAVFSPWLSAAAEIGYGFKHNIEGYLRYTRFQFAEVGANVISPLIVYSTGPFSLSARYFLSIEDSGKVTQAAIGKFYYSLGELLTFWIGGGGGDHADYLEVRGFDTQYFYTIMAGIWWNVDWRNRLLFTYQYRYEKAGIDEYLQNYFILGWQIRF
jgi:tetratricopeptide (TPR) repeat protein